MVTVISLLRLAVGFLWVALTSLVTLVALLPLVPWRIARVKACNVYGKVMGRGVVALAGVTPRIHHRERIDGRRPAIYVGNHTSTLDLFLSIWLCPMGGCGVMKKETARTPFFGQVAALSGHLLLDRFHKERAIEALRDTADFVKSHRSSIWMMPEGTRSKDGRLLPFKKGFVHLAIATGYPVVPVVFHGAHQNWELGTWWKFRPMTLDVEVLEPIDTATWSEATTDQHVAQVHAVFARAVREDQRPLPAPQPA